MNRDETWLEPVRPTSEQYHLVNQVGKQLSLFLTTGDAHYFISAGRFYEDLGETIVSGILDHTQGHRCN